MMIARSIIDDVGSAPNVARSAADSFEYQNRCDWKCSHDREGCIRRTRNNSVGRDHVEIFVRPMRYKGCHQAHNAQVVTPAARACGTARERPASETLHKSRHQLSARLS